MNSGIKNGTQVTLKHWSNVVGVSNDDTNSLYQLLLANTQVWRFCKAFANSSSANAKLSKVQLHKIIQRLIKHLKLPKIKNMMDIKGKLLQWVIDFLTRSL